MLLQDIAALQDAVADIQDLEAGEGGGGGKGGRASLGDGGNDAFFHTRISTLEAKMEDIRGEVQLAMTEVMDGERGVACALLWPKPNKQHSIMWSVCACVCVHGPCHSMYCPCPTSSD